MRKLTLTAAMSGYDHVRDLVDGTVSADGIELIWLDLPVEEIFHRFILHREWDVSEVSMAKYASLVAGGDDSLTAIPVFPSRVFRHSSIYIRADSGLRDPGDLAGRRVGIPEWAQTAAVYTRGLLAHEYGVDLRDIRWFQAGVNQPGRREKVHVNLPAGVTVTPVPDRSLNDLLLAGDVDAVMTARPPAAFDAGDRPGAGPGAGTVVRMLGDATAAEREYFTRTGIFPIMHTVALRRDLLRQYPWVAMSLFKGFARARDNSLARLTDVTASRVPVPWLSGYLRDAWAPFGDDPWPYGVEPNVTTLDAFLRYAHEQGVCERRLSPQELFAPTVDRGYRT